MSTTIRVRKAIEATVAMTLFGTATVLSTPQAPVMRSLDEKILRESDDACAWEANAFVHLQIRSEFTGKNQRVHSTIPERRALYPTGDGRFFAGAGCVARQSSAESIANVTALVRSSR
jgi:hypothetical protein